MPLYEDCSFQTSHITQYNPCFFLADACVARSEEAQNCNVIEGMSTLIIEGPDNSEQEDELMTNFYLQLEEMFDMFSSVEDSNIVSLEYVGSDPSSLMTFAELNEEEEVAANDSTSLFKFIAKLPVDLGRLTQRAPPSLEVSRSPTAAA